MKYYKFEAKKDRNSEVKIFANQKIYQQLESDSIKQLFNAAKLPTVTGVIGLPDMHKGYGLPIGGVMASKNIISPGAVGYDINCGVRLLTTELETKTLQAKLTDLIKNLGNTIPKGREKKKLYNFSKKEFKKILKQGLPYLCNRLNYGFNNDIKASESQGCFSAAKVDKVSNKALKRGSTQLGSLGSGNHFVEIQKVAEIYQPTTQLFKGQLVFMIHSGSRGLGHQIASDYIAEAKNIAQQNNTSIPNENLAYFKADSKAGQDYFAAMSAAANFAFANRQLMTDTLRQIVSKNLNLPPEKITLYQDIAHNTVRKETHNLDEQQKDLFIHRKGACYLPENNTALLPGSMGTASYIIEAKNTKANKLSFYSTAHGAGRKMSRRQAKREITTQKHQASIAKIELVTNDSKNAIDESPLAYKNINSVIDSLNQSGIATPIAKVKPLAVIKG